MNEAKNSMRNAGIFFMVMMLVIIPISRLVNMVINCFPEKYMILISVLMTQGYLLICGLIYMAVTKTKFVADLKIKKFRLSSFFLSILALITAAPMVTWLNIFSQLFVKNQAVGNVFEITELLPVGLGIAVIGCLPGFVEEFLYRGIMFSAFKKRSVLTGVIVSALSFGLMHMNFNQMAYAIGLGILFAFIVEATGSILSTMILHMLFNAVNTLYLYLLPVMFKIMEQYSSEAVTMDLNEVMAQSADKSQLLIMLAIFTPLAIGGVALTVLILKQIAKLNGRTLTWAYIRGEKEEVKQIKPINVCLVIGWIVCLVFCISAM